MQIQLKIQQDNKEPETVVAGVADIIALENHFDIDASTLATRQRMVWLSFLAWSALHRAKRTDETFEQFSSTIVSLELDDSPKE